ncbi:hypothetical protein B0O80DRAFT_429606 [Mortierella sp. GBAus27b]|nr:hypothetical protein B0O80DRAFT_429606 [Mortierella sp. GBAus27b]
MAPLRFVLTVSLAAIAAVVSGAPVPKPTPSPSTPSTTPSDACGALGHKTTNITYDEVAACYQSIPFDTNAAASTLKTVRTLFNDYYVFRDAALSPNLAAPFSSPPVDIVAELDKIGSTQYPNDISFHTAISKTLATLHDAHVDYSVRCFRSFLFAQPLNLYAPVINGKQSVRVFYDIGNRPYQDCEVTTIDGKPALDQIKAFADTLSISKDAGVRLNQALAGLVYNKQGGRYGLSSGDFAERTAMPDKAYVDYELVCPSSTTPIQVRDQWRVLRLTRTAFTSTQTYLANVCAPDPTSSHTNSRTDGWSGLQSIEHALKLGTPSKQSLLRTTRKMSALLEEVSANPGRNAAPAPAPKAPASDAVLVASGNATVFYTLKSKPDVGVIVVFTHDAEDEELDVILNALEIFHKSGVTRLIVDFQGNGGGSVSFASELVQFFFPNVKAFDKSLPSDLRVTPSTLELSNASFNKSSGGLYNAAQYVDWETAVPYKNNGLFQQAVTYTRSGRQAQYTKPSTLYPSDLGTVAQLSTFAWTNKPEQITLLTDGRCGSSCALSTHYFHTLYKVPAIAVGGYQSQPLSMFSFAGGAVSDLDTILKIYVAANVPSPVSPLPYQGAITLPLLEVYATGSQIPLEYDSTQYTANTHIDWDASNSRHRDVLWGQVATQWPGAQGGQVNRAATQWPGAQGGKVDRAATQWPGAQGEVHHAA